MPTNNITAENKTEIGEKISEQKGAVSTDANNNSSPKIENDLIEIQTNFS